MGFNADSKDTRPSVLPVDGRVLQPTSSNRSKAAEAAGVNQNQNTMATIADDDDRLLVRIGYTPVSASHHPQER
jgi:hypothetical protein